MFWRIGHRAASLAPQPAAGWGCSLIRKDPERSRLSVEGVATGLLATFEHDRRLPLRIDPANPPNPTEQRLWRDSVDTARAEHGVRYNFPWWAALGGDQGLARPAGAVAGAVRIETAPFYGRVQGQGGNR